jgi:hypothetical protein
VLASTDGRPVDASKPAPPKPTTREQYTARRNLLWLTALETGLPDPVTGRTRPHSCAELAGLWNTSRGHITMGITRARRLRQQCHNALA